MIVPQNISQFKKWARENKGIKLFLHYDQRKSVRNQVILVLANQSSVLFLDQEGHTFKIAYPKKGHYRFTQDSFSFKTMIFKYRLPENGKTAIDASQAILNLKTKESVIKTIGTIADKSENKTTIEPIRTTPQPEVEFEVTDQEVVTEIAKTLWRLALKYGFERNGNVLILPDNAIEFIKSAPCPHHHLMIFGSQRDHKLFLSQNLYPQVIHRYLGFMELFLNGRESIGAAPPVMNDGLLNLIIGMPPFGDLKALEKLYGDLAFTRATTWSEYYIRRGLDLLLPGGLLVYLDRANVNAGEQTFLQSGINDCKVAIADKVNILTAYRFPTFVWSGQELNINIIVLQKKAT